MQFSDFFDLVNELSDVDGSNFNDAKIENINDFDMGEATSYTLDPAMAQEESFLETISELMDSYNIKNYKIEDEVLIFKLN